MRGWLRLRPGVPDVVFGIVVAMGLVGGRTGFLGDPGTFWHLRLGREILRSGSVPRVDTLTATRAGAILTVPPIMVLWANRHGGFLAGPLIVATAGFGHAISGRLDRPRWRRLAGFAAIFVASCVAPLLNPYGLGLYRHVAGLLVTS